MTERRGLVRQRWLVVVLGSVAVLTAAAPSQGVPGGDFGPAAAINDPSGATPGSFELTRGSQGQSRAVNGQAYQCPKYHAQPFEDGGAQVYAIDQASLTLDSRDNTLEYIAADRWSGFKAEGSPYWRNTGHSGVYTCNWLVTRRDFGYRILARGVYKFDQTAPGAFATADPECATGYFAGPADTFGGKLIPWYYRYFIESVAATPVPRPSQVQVRSQVSVTGDVGVPVPVPLHLGAHVGQEWDPFGSDWRPHRFEWVRGDGKDRVDAFDVLVDLDDQLTWRPLYPRDPASLDPVSGGDPRCSDDGDRDLDGKPDHVYVLDPDPATEGVEPYYVERPPDTVRVDAEPVLFSVLDLVTYIEWDNCGLLQVDIEPQSTTMSLDEIKAQAVTSAPPQQPGCQWWAPDYSRFVTMTSTSGAGQSGQYRFEPSDAVVKPWQKTAASPRLGTQIVWENRDAALHSVTALVDTDGLHCLAPRRLASGVGSQLPDLGVQIFIEDGLRLPEVVSLLAERLLAPALISDECDQPSRTRLFDSSPGCADATAEQPGLCMGAGQRFSWAVGNPETFNESFEKNLCANGYCVIPYYCRILRHEMQGNVIVSLPGPDPAPPPPPLPLLGVADLEVPEGHAGTTTAQVPVSLSAPVSTPVTVEFATADGTATAGQDYTPVSGTLTFAPGTTGGTVAVPVIGDTLSEPDEAFLVRLSNPTGALIGDGEARVAILDDEPPGPPRTLFATPGPERGQVRLRWGAPATGTAGLVGYRVYRDGAPVRDVPVTAGQSPGFVPVFDDQVSDLTRSYTYTVSAYKSTSNVETHSAAARSRPFPAGRERVELVSVDARSGDPVSSVLPLVQGETYLLEARGKFTYRWTESVSAVDNQADARCLIPPGNEAWEDGGADHAAELFVNGMAQPWVPATGGPVCDVHHIYYLLLTPDASGRAHFNVNDTNPGDNAGGLEVRIFRVVPPAGDSDSL